MASVLLFVYGSLKRAGRHHDELGDARFLGEAETTAGYAVVPLTVAVGGGAPNAHETEDYPALIPRAGAGSVVGELFELPEAWLSALDAFEGPEYERVEIEIEVVGGGQKLAALAYLKRSR